MNPGVTKCFSSSYSVRTLKTQEDATEAGETEWESNARPLTSFRDPTH